MACAQFRCGKMDPAWRAALISTALLLAFGGSARAQSDRDQTTPTGWYWLFNASLDRVNDIITDEGARIIDIEVAQVSPIRFNAVFVRNTGAYAKAWWWYFDATSSFLSDRISENNARIIDLDAYEVNGQTRFAAVMIRNTGADAAGWWWLIDTSISTISDFVRDNPARIIDLDTYFINGQRRYSAVMIRNTGGNQRGWWYYVNVSSSFISDKLSENRARLIDIERHAGGFLIPTTYTCVMERPQGQAWWWYINVTSGQLSGFLAQNGARLIDLERHTSAFGGARFNAVMINNSNALTTRVGQILRDGTDGVSGLYLKQVNGPVLAGLQENRIFEPASMIKVLHHVHAMRRVDTSPLSLNNLISTFTGPSDLPNCAADCPNPCPVDTGLFQIPLATALRQMMEQSHNTRTQAVRVFFGEANINNTAQILGMADTLTQARIGCGGGADGALANPNQLTLADAGRLYEAVATGYLTPARRDTFYDLMINGRGNRINAVITEETTAAGLDALQREEFRSLVRRASKGGSYTFNTSSGRVEHRTGGGWVSIPFRNAFCGPAPREYFHGAFVNDATNGSAASNAVGEAVAELLRGEIRAAANSWNTCAPPVINVCFLNPGPQLVEIQGGLGAAPNQFISPLADTVPFDTIAMELSTPSELVSLSLTPEPARMDPTEGTLTDIGGGFHRLVLSRPLALAQWTTIELRVRSKATGCASTISLMVAHHPLDIDQNGVVNVTDATFFGRLFRLNPPPALLDLDGSGTLDIRDATTFGMQWHGDAEQAGWSGSRLHDRVVILPLP